jgi:hypothetical protein
MSDNARSDSSVSTSSGLRFKSRAMERFPLLPLFLEKSEYNHTSPETPP